MYWVIKLDGTQTKLRYSKEFLDKYAKENGCEIKCEGNMALIKRKNADN